MGIKVTYEYICDCCKGEAWPIEVNEYTAHVAESASTLKPRTMKHIEGHVLCPMCYETVREAYVKLFQERNPVEP